MHLTLTFQPSKLAETEQSWPDPPICRLSCRSFRALFFPIVSSARWRSNSSVEFLKNCCQTNELNFQQTATHLNYLYPFCFRISFLWPAENKSQRSLRSDRIAFYGFLFFYFVVTLVQDTHCARVCEGSCQKINGYSYCFTAIYHRMLSSARVVYFPTMEDTVDISIRYR